MDHEGAAKASPRCRVETGILARLGRSSPLINQPGPAPNHPRAVRPPFDLGGVHVEPDLNTVTGPAGSVSVEPKVMEVLVVLVQRRGETVSPQELIDSVWQGRAVVDAVVTRAISELRRALGDDPKAPRFIQTVARRGYRLVAQLDAQLDSPPLVAAPTSQRRSRLLAAALVSGAVLGGASLIWQGLDPAQVEATGLPPEAFGLYAEAKRALSGGSCVAPEVLGQLERVLALAPTSAAAWETYGWAQYNRVSSCGESGTAYVAAMQAAERAHELDPARQGPLAIQAAVLTETGRAELAYDLLAPSLDALEAPVELLALAGYALTYTGALEEAAVLAERVVERDPSFYLREGWTPNALLYLGREARFLEISAQGPSPLARFYRGYAWYRLGQPARALAELAPIFADRPTDPFARQAEAVVALLEGRPEDARLLVGQLALQRQRLRSADGELSFRLAELSCAAGDAGRALSLLEDAVDQGFFCEACFASSAALEQLVESPEFQATVKRARGRAEAFAASRPELGHDG